MTGAPPAAHSPRVVCTHVAATHAVHFCRDLPMGQRGSSPFRWDVGSFDREGPPPPLDAPAPRPSPGRPPIESACGTYSVVDAVTVLVECTVYVLSLVVVSGKLGGAPAEAFCSEDFLLQIGGDGWLHRENHAASCERARVRLDACRGLSGAAARLSSGSRRRHVLLRSSHNSKQQTAFAGRSSRKVVPERSSCVSSGLMDSVITHRRVLRGEVGWQLAGKVSKRLVQGRRV
ncbi:hypothetical protein B0I37DRAFT_79096 [Chaetomium sp. MPI-CAGE-AT-0009]|nr:hypothetical protein B0I37DRAFT_79096 [Chaetomium sp. MPI-CAGE-AT-0009]